MIETTGANSVAATMDKLEAAITAKDSNVVARVNHAAAAQKVDMELRPTETLIFSCIILTRGL